MADYSVAAKITADTSGFTTGIQKASTALSGLGKNLDNFTKNLNTKTQKWGLDFSKFYEKGAGMFRAFGIDIDKFAAKFGTSGMVVAGIATATMALNKLGDAMDKATSAIVKGTGATGKTLRDLEGSVQSSMIAGVGRSAEEVGNMVADLNTRFALTGKTLNETVSLFDKFSSATDTGARESIEKVADVMAKWNVTQESTGALLDQLTVASQASGASVTELMAGLTSGQAIFSQFGMSITDSTAFLASLAQNGVDSGVAIAGLRTALAKFAADGRDADVALQEVTRSIQNAATKTEALSIATETFGVKNGPEMVKVLRESSKSSAEMAKALAGATGAVEMTDKASRTTKDALDDLKASFTGAFGQLGQTVSGTLKDLIDSFRNIFELVGPRLNEIFGVVRTVVTGITGFISNLIEKIADLVKRINGDGGAMSRILNNIKNVFEASFGKMVNAVNAAYELIVVVIDKMKIGFEKLRIGILKAIEPVAKDIADAFNKIIGKVNEGIETVNGWMDDLHLPKSWRIASMSPVDPKFVETQTKAAEERIRQYENEIKNITQGTGASVVKTSDDTYTQVETDAQEASDAASAAAEDMSDTTIGALQSISDWDAKLFKQRMDDLEEYTLDYHDMQVELINQEREKALLADTEGKERAKINAYYNRVVQKENERFHNATVSRYKTVASDIAGVLGKAAKAVASAFKGIFSAVGSVFTKLKEWGSTTVSDMLDNLLSFEDAILTFFVEVLPNLPQFVASAFQSVVTLIKTIMASVNFNSILDSFLEVIGKMVVNLSENMRTIGEGLGNLVKTVLSKIPDLLRSVIDLAVSLLTEGLPSLLEIVADSVVDLIEKLPSILEEGIPKLLTGIFSFIESLFKNAGKIALAVINRLPEILGKVINGIIDWLSNLSGEDIAGFISSIVKMVADIASALLSNIGKLVAELIPAMVKLVSELIMKIPDIITGVVSGAWEGLGSLGTSVVEGAKGIVSGIGNGISAAVQGIGDFFGKLFTGKLFADGTDHAPRGLAIVGEAGPELVNFRGGEQVLSNRNTKQALAGASSNTFNVTFNNLADTSAYAMIQQLKDYNRSMAINGII